MVSRSGPVGLPQGAESIAIDVTRDVTDRRLIDGVRVVFQALNPAYHRWAEDFPGLQRAAIRIAERAGARLVVVDNVYAYGRSYGRPLTEATPERPHTRKGRARMIMNSELWAAHRAGRVEAVAGRAADYFGPDAGLGTVLGDPVITAVRSGRTARLLGDPDTRHSFGYLPDLAAGLVLLGDHPAAPGRVWHLPADPEPWTTRAMVTELFRLAGHRPRIRRIPMIMVRAAGLVDRTARELVEMEYEFAEDFVVDGSAIAALGATATPVRRALVDWLTRVGDADA
ncbi:NAD-dependent epimerase/dehydratase family protein [Microlunatus sp. GCM10028923]|uniref:NAD-dependent epimerase/dehydratase family protein n=1 Tax=Microlunatus sp. GCM10028923 TaxID=3273400 RepID=UPI003611F28F